MAESKTLDIPRIQRRLLRFKTMRDNLMKGYGGRESSLTFHAGWDIGYLLGKIAVLEDILDELEIDEEVSNESD